MSLASLFVTQVSLNDLPSTKPSVQHVFRALFWNCIVLQLLSKRNALFLAIPARVSFCWNGNGARVYYCGSTARARAAELCITADYGLLQSFTILIFHFSHFNLIPALLYSTHTYTNLVGAALLTRRHPMLPHKCTQKDINEALPASAAMLGAFRGPRILRCFGSVWDPEALLRSVLKLQATQSTKEEHFPRGAAAARTADQNELASLTTSALKERPNEALWSQFYRSLPEPPSRCQRTPMSNNPRRDERPSAVSAVVSTELRASQMDGALPPSAGGVPSQDPTPTELCFTLVAARANPTITFSEILLQWERFVERYGSHYTELLTPQLRRSEAALLNFKLMDPVLGQLAAMDGAPYLPGKTPKYMAEVLNSNAWSGVHGEHSDDAGNEKGGSAVVGCYGLPHFSAELGDVGYLESLLRAYPHGFLLRWLSSPSEFTYRNRGAGTEAAEQNLTMSDAFRFAKQTAPSTGQQTNQSQGQATELHSFEHIAAKCPDHFGLFLGHLASYRGHIAYVDFLISALGASFVLEEQRCTEPISTLFTWGVQRYTPGLNAAQCAVAGNQVAFLEWIECEHPSALHSLFSNATVSALTAATMLMDHSVDVFDFFRSRNLFPISEFLGDKGNTASTRARDGSGVLRVLFAAAEVGNFVLLKWFDEALGRTDVRLLCDQRGATVLHHCARGCKVEMLGALLGVSSKESTATDAETGAMSWVPLDPLWVDVEDDRGRTPAMWCVMSAARSTHIVETLEVLRKAGSDWPRARRSGGSLLDVATRFLSRHSKVVRYLRKHMLLSGLATVSTSG